MTTDELVAAWVEAAEREFNAHAEERTEADAAWLAEEAAERARVSAAAERAGAGATIPEFPPADYYDCADSEVFTHTTPEEAVESFVDDGFCTRDMVAVIREIGKVTMDAYVTEVVSPEDKQHMARRLRDVLDEEYGESEYANPNGGDPDQTALAAAEPHLTAAVDAFCAAQKVWTCKRVAGITLTPEQVEAMMRIHRPDWFGGDR